MHKILVINSMLINYKNKQTIQNQTKPPVLSLCYPTQKPFSEPGLQDEKHRQETVMTLFSRLMESV